MLQKFCSVEFPNPFNFYFLVCSIFRNRGHRITDDKSSAAYKSELMSVLRGLSDLSMEAPFDEKINVVYLDESRRTPVHRAALDGKHEQVKEKVRVGWMTKMNKKGPHCIMRPNTDTGTFARFISKRFKVKCHNVKRMIPNKCHSWRSQTQFSSPLILISENNTYCKIYKLQWMRSY